MHSGTAERYLDLYKRFAEESNSIGTPVEVSLEELAEVLYCTTRNVKLVLRKMEEEGLIQWLPGRGRGNRSRLIFLVERDAKLLDLARQMAQRGDYKLAFELIHKHGSGSHAKERFAEWLDQHFGYRAEAGDGKLPVDTLRMPVQNPIITLDPGDVYFSFDAHMVRQVFDCLVELDTATGRVVPALAHAWECNNDATVWQFHLRKGVHFHNGHPLTVEDVLFTLERLRSGKSHSWVLRSVLMIEAVGPRTIRIALAKPNRIFHRFMCSTTASIVPKEAVLKEGEAFWRSPVGTGPFMITEWNEDRLMLAANPSYYRERAHLDGVEIAFMPPEHGVSSRKCWEKLLVDHNSQEQQPDMDLDSVEVLSQGCTLITWNMGRQGPQQSPLFRKAIDLLIDRKRMIEELGEERMYPAHGFRPDEHTPYRSVRYDPVEADMLLRAAGYDGTPITLFAGSSYRGDTAWIQARCAEHGIPVNIQIQDGIDYKKRRNVQEADCVLYSIVLDQDEVCEIESYEQQGSFLKEHLHPEFREWSKRQIDLALAAKSTDERRILLGQIEERLREETYVLFLIHRKNNAAYQPGLKGITVSPLGWIDFKDVWVQSAEKSTVGVGGE
ncbi:ABC transporter substrate-binding protein [Paenibacillus sp. OV219]|uniref:ABC transporter substrate-binding protein n=1 Tax=Paenibacillus sp. OV219 TaxID=1884377 RepID=UPI0008B07356|nr:ABC transporter substrate-binding protein [Paenibacillus sp. OV219]SEM51658.1 DNA-binding transcriptional regulator SgrR of sgrS sRNA, contains a MarR-type HTH domain and a solute-binding domain [Paenibacillus sp. OV219]